MSSQSRKVRAIAAVVLGVVVSTSGALLADAPISETASTLRQLTVDADPVAAGTATQTLSVDIPREVSILAGTPTAPDGWTIEYSDDGSTWDTTTAGDPLKVRATGTFESLGANGDYQVLETEAAGQPFSVDGWQQPTTSGDGWDVFFGLGRIFNVWHHSESYVGIDCHERTTALPCWTLSGLNMPFIRYGYQTPNHSTGFVHEGTRKLWTLVRRISDSTAGFICADLTEIATPTSCSPEYTPLTATGAADSWQDLGDVTRIGDKVFFRLVDANSSLYCLDLDSGAACSSQPFASGGSSGLPVGSSTYHTNRSIAVNDLLYVDSSTDIGCFNPATNTSCSGTWPVTVADMGALFTWFDTAGDEIGVCGIVARTCVDFAGATSPIPTGLYAALDAHPQSWFWNEWAGLGSADTVPRYYWTLESDHTKMQCYDFTTDDVCTGFTIPSLGLRTYGVREDPADPGCLWSNSDVGQVVAFNATTGAVGCNVIDAVLRFPVETLAPRNRCDGSFAVSSWSRLKLNLPVGVASTDVIVTVRNSSGDLIPDWTSKTVNGSGVLSLAALDPARTGDTPSFSVQVLNTDDATGITGALRYTTLPAQFCVTLYRKIVCPTSGSDPVIGLGEKQFAYSIDGGAITAETSSYTVKSLTTDCESTTTTGSSPPTSDDPSDTSTSSSSTPPGDPASDLPPSGASTGTTRNIPLLALLLIAAGAAAIISSAQRSRLQLRGAGEKSSSS